MAVFNSMLNIMPYNCRYCVGGYLGMAHVSDESLLRGVQLIELRKEQAEKGPVWQVLQNQDPVFVNGFGHGNRGRYTGDSETDIFTSEDCSILGGRVVYLLSCLTANELGPAAVANGAIAYAGFIISWTWMAVDIYADPYTDWYAEGFYRASNAFPNALLQGFTVGQAKDKSIEEYNRWIGIWETERADDKYAASAIKYLLLDRDGLTVFGDTTATISSAAGVRTSLIVMVSPPDKIHTNELFTIKGKLYEHENGDWLADQAIELHELSEHKILGTAVTDGDGEWAITTSLTKGEKRLYAIFNGDNTYGPSASQRYEVIVGFTSIEVITEPESSVEVNERVTILWRLIDETTNVGIGGALLKLIVDNKLETQYITDVNGYWGFSISFPEISRHTLRAEFPGTHDFVSSDTKDYRISVGILPTIGNTTLPPPERRRYINCQSYIKGKRVEVPENGLLESIVVYGEWLPGKVQGAAYKWVNDNWLELIGVTEIQELDGEVGWILLVFGGKEKINKGDTIVLCIHSSVSSTVLYDALVPVGNDGMESGQSIFYYPQQLTALHWQPRDYSIYAEYIKEEVSEMIHKESRESFTFRVVVQEEEHDTLTMVTKGFDQAIPGESKTIQVGVRCAVNGQACNLQGKTVHVLDQWGTIIGTGTLGPWNPMFSYYVSGLITATAPGNVGEYTWDCVFPRQ